MAALYIVARKLSTRRIGRDGSTHSSCLAQYVESEVESGVAKYLNKTKVIRADLLDFDFDFDFDFEDIIRFGNISVLVTFQFW